MVVYFTQSGQMLTIARKFCESFASDTAYSIAYEELKPVSSYPFPWSAFTFFNGFPEVFYEKPVALQPYSDKLNDIGLSALVFDTIASVFELSAVRSRKESAQWN